MTYGVRVRSSANGGGVEETFTIRVTEANEAPTDISLDNTSVPEGASPGTVVGTLATSDPDNPDDSHTYELLSGTGFRVVGETLRTAAVLDHEAGAVRTVRVRTTDRQGMPFEKSFGITVTDVNEPPTGTTLSGGGVAENLPAGTAVGTLATEDPDAGDAHTYTLTAGAGLFAISGRTLVTAVPLDHEAHPAHTVRVRTADRDGLSRDDAFSVTVTDANDPPTGIGLSRGDVDENLPAGTAVGTLSATDQDAGETHTYALVPGDGDADNGSLVIEAGTLRTAEVFDFETREACGIRVRVTDSHGAVFDKPFTITVNDANDPPTDILLDGGEGGDVDENRPVGTTVGTLTAADPDPEGAHTFGLVPGDGDDDNGSFEIDGDVLVTREVLDFETASGHGIRLRVTDNEGGTFEKIFEITVNDKNDAPVGLTIEGDDGDDDPHTAAVDENAEIGTVVGTLATEDPDAGDTHTCEMAPGEGDDDNDRFALGSDDEGNLVLETAEVLDFETRDAHTVRIRTTDSHGAWFEEVLEIGVRDVNDTPVGLTIECDDGDDDPHTAAVDENVAVGTAVGTLATEDPDAGDAHTCTLVPGEGDDDNDRFTLGSDDDGNAVLETAGVLDFEERAGHTVRIRTTDAHGAWFEETLAITVRDVNEHPTDIAVDPESVPENRAVGTVVGELVTTDPDAGDAHTYELVSADDGTPDDNALFGLDVGGEGGTLLLTGAEFDHEARDTCTIRVRTTDRDGLSLERTLTVRIADVNEPPADMRLGGSDGTDIRLSVPENQPPGVVVGRLGVSDPDMDEAHTFHRVVHLHRGWMDNGSFILERDGVGMPPHYEGNTLLTAESFDYESRTSHSIYLRCNDSGGGSCFRVFTIHVEDVNEPPTGLVISFRWIGEEQPAGTPIGFLTTLGDPDTDETHTCTLVPGEGDDDNGLFAIRDDNVLETAAVLDFEGMDDPVLRVRIRTEDSGGLGHEERFEVTLRAVNEDPSEITLSGNQVAERLPAGTAVGVLAATDPDDLEGVGTYAYELTDDCPDNEYFSIDGGTLVTGAVLDHGIREGHTLCIRVTDGHGGERLEEFDIAVLPHEAPVLPPDTVAILDPITEKETGNNGNSVPEILEDGPVVLADGSLPAGIAVTSVGNIGGIWQCSTDGGREWRNLTEAEGREVDLSDVARLLPAEDRFRMRFVPYPTDEGDITATFTFRVWDMSQGVAGETANATRNGGRTSFSAETAEGSVMVSEVTETYEVNVSGTVRDAHGNPVSAVAIVIWSEEGVFLGRGESDVDGHYEIIGDGDPLCHSEGRSHSEDVAPPCYLENSDYTFEIRPPLQYPPHDESITESLSFTEDGSLTRDIILSRPGMICGQISDRDGSPIPGAKVGLHSRTSGTWRRARSGDDGTYRFEDLPDASDYVVWVVAEGHSWDWMTDRSPGTSVSFHLRASASITGCVRDEAGATLASATVEIRSESSDVQKATVTAGDGRYEFPNLPADETYEVTVRKAGHVSQSKHGIRAGDDVSLTLTRGERLTGTVADSEGAPPPDGVIVLVKMFRHDSWGCIGRERADDEGNFEITGLAADTACRLNFRAYHSDMPLQWAGPDGSGVADSGDAGAHSPGDVLNFRFDRPW